jgi:hypothetical protein
MNKTMSHLNMFKKIKLTHRCFKFLSSICTRWIICVNFLHFRSSKIRLRSTGVVSTLSPLWCRFFYDQRCHVAAPCHASFSLSQDKFVAFASFSGNTLSRRLPSRAETKALNPHHHHRLLSLDRLTHTLHCYKKIITTLATLPTIQPHLHFASFQVRASCHQNSTHHRHFLSPLSHAHRASTQRYPRWRSS